MRLRYWYFLCFFRGGVVVGVVVGVVGVVEGVLIVIFKI